MSDGIGTAPERTANNTAADRVASIFNEVFGTADLTPAADFFKLGGDSLMAEALMAAIEREFRVTLPTSLLLEASTPARLSMRLSGDYRKAQDDTTCLVPIHPDGGGTPLFWVHGMTGYLEMADDIDAGILGDRPLYGFRPLGLKRNEMPLGTIPQIAAYYIKALREVRPTGPYLLGGQCTTGFIALEMARQLADSGDAVIGVILIDPFPPLPCFEMRNAALAQQMQRLKDQYAGQIKRMPRGGYLTQAGRDKFVFETLRIITGLHTPRSFEGPVLLVCTEQSAPILLGQNGMPSITPQLEWVRIGKEHLDPFRQDLAAVNAAIGTFLDRVDPVKAVQR